MKSRQSPRVIKPIPEAVLKRLRAICVELPEVSEESAWVGVRWRIRRNTFAHVLMIEDGWPPAYAAASGISGSACVLTFRTVQRLLQPDEFNHHPFFRPPWFPNIMGLIIDDRVAWREVRQLIHESFRLMAPRTLAFGDLSAKKATDGD